MIQYDTGHTAGSKYTLHTYIHLATQPLRVERPVYFQLLDLVIDHGDASVATVVY